MSDRVDYNELSNQPNFVIILADDMGYGDPGCYHGWINTPNLEKLTTEGMKFNDFHASGAVCSPTRVGLMTGRYQQRAGIPGVITAANHRHQGLQPEEITFADLLKNAGYETAVYGKWHLGYATKYNPIQHGFNDFRGYVSGNIDYISHIDQTGIYDWWHQDKRIEEEGYVTHLVTEHAVKFIEENKENPFCLYMAHEAPHYPYQGPQDQADRTVNSEFPVRGSREDKKEAYKEMVVEMDKGIGQVIKTLKENNLEQNTLVFFFSDNGPVLPLGSSGVYRGSKGQVWEGGHRVPAIAWWPGKIKPGSVCNQPLISLDLMPTLLSLSNISISDNHKVDGINLSSLLLSDECLGESLDERNLFWQHGNQKAIRKGKWKLIKGIDDKNESRLFNLDEDPGENNNIADKYPELVLSMEKELKDWLHNVKKGATVQPVK